MGLPVNFKTSPSFLSPSTPVTRVILSIFYSILPRDLAFIKSFVYFISVLILILKIWLQYWQLKRLRHYLVNYYESTSIWDRKDSFKVPPRSLLGKLFSVFHPVFQIRYISCILAATGASKEREVKVSQSDMENVATCIRTEYFLRASIWPLSVLQPFELKGWLVSNLKVLIKDQLQLD